MIFNKEKLEAAGYEMYEAHDSFVIQPRDSFNIYPLVRKAIEGLNDVNLTESQIEATVMSTGNDIICFEIVNLAD